MQVFSRARPNGNSLASCLTPNGLQLAMPFQPETSSGTAMANALGISAAEEALQTPVVLMYPSRANHATCMPLHALIVLDVCAVCGTLYELHWRTINADALLAFSICALISDAVGTVACHRRLPSLLGLFAVFTFVQFFITSLLLSSLLQLCHCALQLLLTYFALALRRSMIPLWFTTGRR